MIASPGNWPALPSGLPCSWSTQPSRRKRRAVTKRSGDDSGSEFSLSDEEARSDDSTKAPSDSASFETDTELSDDPLGEYDDADDDSYEQRRHKYVRGQSAAQPPLLLADVCFLYCLLCTALHAYNVIGVCTAEPYRVYSTSSIT